jgi:hypothetical protein
MNKIKIVTELTEANQLATHLYIDGHQIKGVRSLTFHQGLDDIVPILTIDLNAVDVDLEAYLNKIHVNGMGDVEEIKFKRD